MHTMTGNKPTSSQKSQVPPSSVYYHAPPSRPPPSHPPPLGTRPPPPPSSLHPPMTGQHPCPPQTVRTLSSEEVVPLATDGSCDTPAAGGGQEGKIEPKGQGEGEEKEQKASPDVKSGERGGGEGGKVKVVFGGLGKRPTIGGGITMKLKPQVDAVAKKSKTDPVSVQSKPASKLVAQAFGSDSEEEEDMPPEAKLRMKNIGRDTPTSSGPNSFYKSSKGFTDPRASWRGELEDN